MASALALWMRRIGLAPGDAVALMLRNSPLALALLFAIAKARAVWVPINVQSRGENLGYIFNHSAPKLIIAEADAHRDDRGERRKPHRRAGLHHRGGAGGRERARRRRHGTRRRPRPTRPSPSCTRPARPAARRACWSRTACCACRARRSRWSRRRVPATCMFMWEPLYHIGGAQMIVLPLIRDVTLALVEHFSRQPLLEPGAAPSGATPHPLPRRHPADPAEAAALGARSRSMARASPGAAAARARSGAPFEQRFGVQIRECYGMTECSSITTYNDNGRGRLGRPAGAVVRGRADRRRRARRSPAGERGEIVVRTSLPGAITRGYLSNPEATARALRGDAFHTGDLGSFDADGNMYFHGRMTDNVRVRGENVSALEVEQVAAKHPAVEDCAMIGVAAEIGEQEIKLFVKRRAGAALDAAGAVGLARRAARALSEPALHRHGRRIRAHREPAHHEAQAAARRARMGPDGTIVLSPNAVCEGRAAFLRAEHLSEAFRQLANCVVRRPGATTCDSRSAACHRLGGSRGRTRSSSRCRRRARCRGSDGPAAARGTGAPDRAAVAGRSARMSSRSARTADAVAGPTAPAARATLAGVRSARCRLRPTNCRTVSSWPARTASRPSSPRGELRPRATRASCASVCTATSAAAPCRCGACVTKEWK